MLRRLQACAVLFVSVLVSTITGCGMVYHRYEVSSQDQLNLETGTVEFSIFDLDWYNVPRARNAGVIDSLYASDDSTDWITAEYFDALRPLVQDTTLTYRCLSIDHDCYSDTCDPRPVLIAYASLWLKLEGQQRQYVDRLVPREPQVKEVLGKWRSSNTSIEPIAIPKDYRKDFMLGFKMEIRDQRSDSLLLERDVALTIKWRRIIDIHGK